MSSTHEFDPYRSPPTQQRQLDTRSTLLPNRTRDRIMPHHGDFALDGHHGARTIWIIALTGLGVVLAVLLITLGVLVEVFAVHNYHIEGGALLTTAPLGRTLTIAHLSGSAVAVTVPLVVGLGAYVLAGRWVAASRIESANRPTPFQLGILMRTLGGASISSLWDGASYVHGRRGPGGKELARPPILYHSVTLVFYFLTLAYGLSGVDTWLGATSTAVIYPLTTDIAPSAQFGRQVNQTLCSQTFSNNLPYQCGLVKGSGGNPQEFAIFINTVQGLNPSNSIAITDDSTAIFVPPASQLDDSIGYRATTLGIKSNCTSVTAQCIPPGVFQVESGLLLNCTEEVNFNITGASSQGCGYGEGIGGPLDPEGNLLGCQKSNNSTDIRFAMEVTSAAYHANISSSGEVFVGDTGFYLHGSAYARNVLVCDIHSLDVTYDYFNGSYSTVSSSPSDLEQAARASDGSWAGLTYVANAVDGVGMYSGSYVDAFANQLSLVTLATTWFVMEPIEVLSAQSTVVPIGARLPLAPFLLVIIIPFVYCVSVLLLTVSAVIATLNSPYTAFARSRLMDPVTAIGTAYGPEDTGGSQSPLEPVHGLFKHETAADRLTLEMFKGPDGAPRAAVRRPTFSVEDLEK
ncbi:hypothetical protein FB45DRAFT_1004706 [Roridomyces roridus]|uniref:Uncharacterized protein n=1 Tax=Roridomyces roridus TaxID=1738132 RepID=A0AAD7BQD4_9AGAR|nr:hypothetical protein FB45DRAFT_1004706 [Roridomyces roridus]